MTAALARAESRAAAPAVLAATCYRRPWRLVAALLAAASAGGIPLVLLRIALADDPPLTVLPLLALVATLVVIPAGLGALFRRAFAATIVVAGDTLVLARRDVRVEIPRSAIVAVVPWTVPLPTPGASLALRSGRPLGWELGLTSPRALAALLAEHGSPEARTDETDAALLHADARGTAGQLRWWHWLLKFPVLGLAPTAVLFRAHQWITYGGTFGEYYQYGALPYVLTFLDYWTTITIYLALWAGLWRVIAEILAWVAARLAPRTTVGVRRAVEVGCRGLYYGGVPVLLALRFMP